MKEIKTIKEDGSIEIDIKKSRFICYVKRVETEEQARDFIASIKKEHHKANHNCSAFILGEQAEIKRSSDDGEPSGTAGVPMLTVLENHDLTNLVVVVTRYFGGIKLGAGGLIRAYAGAVAEAIKTIGCVVVKEQQGLELTLTYSQYQDFTNWCSSQNLVESDTQFLENVSTTLFLDKEMVKKTMADLVEYYHGKVEMKKTGLRVVEVPIN